MARPPKFSSDQLLDAARSAVARHGREATIGQVSEQIGAPTGSIYHRFPSREELFVALWMRSVRRFQAGLFEATALPEAEQALVSCAVHVPRYCRAHPEEAMALTLYRQRRLLGTAPPALREAVRTLNDDITAALTRLCARRYGATTPHLLTLVSTATQQCPYGLLRPYLGGTVPAWLDDAVRVTTTAILALGDRPAGAAPGS